MTDARARRSRYVPLLIVAVFLVPLAAAYLYQPRGEPGNHGTLIEPPQPLAEFTMTDLDGNEVGRDVLRDQWTLMYVGGERCAQPCRTGLYNIERARLAQGKHMERVQSLYLAPPAMSARSVAETLVEYSGVRGYRIATDQLEAMAPGIDWQRAPDPGAPQRVYLVDPLGNLMMFYPGGADPGGMQDDLERLLKVSRIG